MTIPTYDKLMLPVLKRSGEKLWHIRDLVEKISDDIGLTVEERIMLIPSGGETVISSRVQWAKTYLKQAGLIEQPKRAFVTISEVGKKVLLSQPARIDLAFLQQFPQFIAFQNRTRGESNAMQQLVSTVQAPPNVEPTSTPEEQITSASMALDEALRDAVLARVMECSPAFFERMIVDLLLKMGYGGSRAAAGEQLGGSGDGGLDGVIREDQLGLDRIYLQAKRYQPGNSVSPEAVRAFVGALVGRGAQKGVFITTSTYTKAAHDAAERSGNPRIVLIDGDELTRLLLRFEVGVRVARTVELKRIDLDYFEAPDTD